MNNIKVLLLGATALILCACAPNNLAEMKLDAQHFNKLKSDMTFAKHEAQAGDVVAMEILSQKYINGDGVEKNIREGMAWADKAAEKGNSSSKLMAAGIYLDEPTKDYTKARFLLEKAVSEDSKNAGLASFMLAEIYANGLGVVKDEKVASEWLLKANKGGIATPPEYMYLTKK